MTLTRVVVQCEVTLYCLRRGEYRASQSHKVGALWSLAVPIDQSLFIDLTLLFASSSSSSLLCTNATDFLIYSPWLPQQFEKNYFVHPLMVFLRGMVCCNIINKLFLFLKSKQIFYNIKYKVVSLTLCRITRSCTKTNIIHLQYNFVIP